MKRACTFLLLAPLTGGDPVLPTSADVRLVTERRSPTDASRILLCSAAPAGR